jgi:hypothetical protein
LSCLPLTAFARNVFLAVTAIVFALAKSQKPKSQKANSRKRFSLDVIFQTGTLDLHALAPARNVIIAAR